MLTNGTYPIRMNQGLQIMNIQLNGGSVVFQVMVDGAWVDDTTISADGRHEVATEQTQGQMVISGGAKVEWRK